MITVAQSIKREFDKYQRTSQDNVYHLDCYLEMCMEKCETHYNDNTQLWRCDKDVFVDYDWHVFEFNDGSRLRLSAGWDADVGVFETCEVL